MNRKLLAKIFYWLFLKKDSCEFYNRSGEERYPTEIGEAFYRIYHYLNH